MVTDCYFSSTHNISKIISEQIFEAKKCILLAMYTLTDRGLINALKDKRQNGIDVLAIFDEDQLAKYSDIILELNNADIVFKTIGKEVARMHHKFLIIDDIKVITGSFNWTHQANKSNMENIMIVENKIVAKAYISEFDKIWQLIASKGIKKYLPKKSNVKKSNVKKVDVNDDIDILIEALIEKRKEMALVGFKIRLTSILLDLEKKGEDKKALRIVNYMEDQKISINNIRANDYIDRIKLNN